MNQADVSKLISKLRMVVAPRHRNLKNADGTEGRLLKLRKTVTALIKYERIELNYNRADEARGYAERLISDAIRHGDCHTETMETADYWLLEKELVHKLFKVLVPRYQDSLTSYTKLLRAPKSDFNHRNSRALLELQGNPYPSLQFKQENNKFLIQNILLEEAKRAYRTQKYNDVAGKIKENND